MQAFGETLFDVVYLVLVITVGIKMIRQSKGDRQYRLFGIMAVTGVRRCFSSGSPGICIMYNRAGKLYSGSWHR